MPPNCCDDFQTFQFTKLAFGSGGSQNRTSASSTEAPAGSSFRPGVRFLESLDQDCLKLDGIFPPAPKAAASCRTPKSAVDQNAPRCDDPPMHVSNVRL